MISKFYIECEDLSPESCEKLGSALEGLAEGDLPFLLEIVFVGEAEIRDLNARMRGVDAVTDVLSFPAIEDMKGLPVCSDEHGECIDSDGRLQIGCVAICTARAREQAEEYGHSYERELFYLAVHGALHCLGYDHETEEDKREMRAREEEVMARMNLAREDQ